jgi:hypothetical protein
MRTRAVGRGILLKEILDICSRFVLICPSSRPRGALPEAFESGAASALGEAALPSGRFAAPGVGGGGRASGRRLTRCWADRSQRSDQGPPPVGARREKARHPAWAAVSPVPACRGCARALKALAAGDGWPPQVPKREARDQERRAGGLVRLAPGGSPSFLLLPVHVRPDASTDQASRSPRGTADGLSINAPGRSGRGDNGARRSPRPALTSPACAPGRSSRTSCPGGARS